MNINMPHAEFNAAVKDGSAGHKMERILQECKPEAVYFTERNGHRGATVIVEIDHVSQIPELAEPWFLNFNAGGFPSCKSDSVFYPPQVY